MNFDWLAEDHELKKRVLAIFDAEAVGELESIEECDSEALRHITKRFLGRLGPTDYLRLGVGPEGSAQTLHLLAAQEELAGISRSLFVSIEVTARLFGGLLKGFCRSSTAAEIAQSVAGGGTIGAVGITEPPRVDGEAHAAACSRVGDRLIVSADKDFVTNAPIADWIAVVLDEGGDKTVCLVRPEQEGVTVGPRMKTLGYRGLAVSSLTLRDVEVQPELVFGPFHESTLLDFLRQTEDLILSAASVGLMNAVIAKAKAYAQSHRRGGKPIFAHQEIRFKLAEMLTLYQSAQLLVFRAGWMISAGKEERKTLVRCAKVFASEAAEKVAGMALQILSGQGYLSGNLIEQAYRDAKYSAIAGTTSERARMEIADDVLARYG
ncbi:MAG: acyl-CoA dehydrogenase family protein [Desulfomonilaceae bacterium]